MRLALLLLSLQVIALCATDSVVEGVSSALGFIHGVGSSIDWDQDDAVAIMEHTLLQLHLTVSPELAEASGKVPAPLAPVQAALLQTGELVEREGAPTPSNSQTGLTDLERVHGFESAASSNIEATQERSPNGDDSSKMSQKEEPRVTNEEHSKSQELVRAEVNDLSSWYRNTLGSFVWLADLFRAEMNEREAGDANAGWKRRAFILETYHWAPTCFALALLGLICACTGALVPKLLRALLGLDSQELESPKGGKHSQFPLPVIDQSALLAHWSSLQKPRA